MTVIEWAINTTRNPKMLRDTRVGVLYCCHWRQCGGIMDYVYGCWWKCRNCKQWGRIW